MQALKGLGFSLCKWLTDLDDKEPFSSVYHCKNIKGIHKSMVKNSFLLKCMFYIFSRKELLKMSSGIEEIGSVQWQVALCLLLAWALTFLALSKGVKSVGKVTVFFRLIHW